MMQTLSTLRKIPQKEEDYFTSKLGMVIVIGSLTMFFITLLISYSILRARSGFWAEYSFEIIPTLLAYINTGVILLSSFTHIKGLQSIKYKCKELTLKWINTTIILGIIFLIFQIVLWFLLTNNGFIMTSSQISGVFYLLSGLHGIHILGGLIIQIWLNRKIHLIDNYQSQVRLVGMFWHFLTVVWLIIFITVIII